MKADRASLFAGSPTSAADENPPMRLDLRARRFAFVLTVASAALGACLSGCAVVSVAGAAAGAAITVTGAVVSTTVTVAGKVAGKAIDMVGPSPAQP